MIQPTPIYLDGWLFYYEPCSVCRATTTVLRFYFHHNTAPVRLCRECLPVHHVGRSLRFTIQYWLWLRGKYHRAAAVFTAEIQAEQIEHAKLTRLLGPLAELSL